MRMRTRIRIKFDPGQNRANLGRRWATETLPVYLCLRETLPVYLCPRETLPVYICLRVYFTYLPPGPFRTRRTRRCLRETLLKPKTGILTALKPGGTHKASSLKARTRRQA